MHTLRAVASCCQGHRRKFVHSRHGVRCAYAMRMYNRLPLSAVNLDAGGYMVVTVLHECVLLATVARHRPTRSSVVLAKPKARFGRASRGAGGRLAESTSFLGTTQAPRHLHLGRPRGLSFYGFNVEVETFISKCDHWPCPLWQYQQSDCLRMT